MTQIPEYAVIDGKRHILRTTLEMAANGLAHPEYIDAEIRTLILDLNKIPGVVTLFSCAGYGESAYNHAPHTPEDLKKAYLVVSYTNDTFDPRHQSLHETLTAFSGRQEVYPHVDASMTYRLGVGKSMCLGALLRRWDAIRKEVALLQWRLRNP